MLIQKTFQMAMRSEVAREKLLNLKEYRSSLAGLERVTFEPNGLLRLRFPLRGGFRCWLYLAREWGEDDEAANEVLFRSHGGNVELYGALGFKPVRVNLTEVRLTLEYRFTSPFYRWFDRWQHVMEAYLDRQIEAVEAHFARSVPGIRADRNLPTPMNGHSKDEAA